MTTLTWQPEFVLQQPHMDHTHLEFVELLAATEAAPTGPATDAALRELLAHTEAHFAQEERWMEQLGFSDDNCHAGQHQGVLEVMREVARRHGLAADPALVNTLVAAVAEWFASHATSADAGLALLMEERGFDPHTGAQREPQPAGAPALAGCDGAPCG